MTVDEIRLYLRAAAEGYAVHAACGGECRNFGLPGGASDWLCNDCGMRPADVDVIQPWGLAHNAVEIVSHLLRLVSEPPAGTARLLVGGGVSVDESEAIARVVAAELERLHSDMTEIVIKRTCRRPDGEGR